MESLPQRIGVRVVQYAGMSGRLFFFWANAMGKCVTPRFYFAETIRQIYSIGVNSLLLTSTVALSVGLVLAMQTMGTLQTFGAVNYVSIVVGLAVVKELGPVFTALMVAGRAGSGICAELGSMKVTRQIDALTVSAINPMRYLVATRIVACMIAVPLLTIIADVLGVLGGLIIGVVQGGISFHLYMSYTLTYVGLTDIIPGLLKTIVFGMIVGTVASFYGFETTGGTEGVGNSTKASVVTSSLLIVIFDVILTRILLGIFGS